MTTCILCSKPTEGSIGAAGIKWTCICQECKDKEDRALADRLHIQATVINTLFPIKEVLNE